MYLPFFSPFVVMWTMDYGQWTVDLGLWTMISFFTDFIKRNNLPVIPCHIFSFFFPFVHCPLTP